MQSALSLSTNRLLKILLFLLFFLSSNIYAQEDLKGNKQTLSLLPTNSIAPVNVLKDISNSEHTFPTANKWNIIFYWSLFCHSCIEEMPEIQTNLEKIKDISIFFVSLDTEKMQKALINFKKRRKFSSTILMEKIEKEKYLTADTWGVTMTPSIFVVNPNGIITFAHQGPIDVDLLLNNLPKEIIKSSENENNEK